MGRAPTGSVRRAAGALALALGLLCGCDIHPVPAPAAPAGGAVLGSGWGLATPETIGAFVRAEMVHTDKPDDGITAGYAHAVGNEAVIATVRVRPGAPGDVLLPSFSLDGRVDSDASARALAGSIAQVRRFYPKAELLSEADAFVVKRGGFQRGRSAVLQYHELHGGAQRAMRLQIYSFCCAGGRWLYEYRFRYPAGLEDELAIAVFLRESSWSAAAS